MIGSISVPYLGTFLPTPWKYTRITADHPKAEISSLAQRTIACSFETVVAAFPQWAETYRLNRYPSPDGRPFALVQGPPFFAARSEACESRREVAQIRRRGRDGFDAGPAVALSARSHNHSARGDIRCSSSNLSLFWGFWARLRPAATRCPNRRFSAGPRAPARRPSWGDRCLPGRRWALRATWRSAKSTRKNACNLNNAPGTGRLNLHETTPRVSGAVVFSYHPRPATAPGRARLKGT